MADLDLIDLSKDYGNGHRAVDSISLHVEDREFVVIVGPSGSGKSTTLRLIAGIEDETAGEIRIGGQRVNDLSPGARDLAMVFQDYALYPHMSVAANIGFGLRRRGVPRPEVANRVREVAEMLDIAPLLNRRPAALSGGQRQRVAMGRAMVRRPRLFLFDEPLSNLDALLRIATRAEIKRMQSLMPTTTIYVTHDQTEAMTMADRVVVMNEGRIVQAGPPMEIYRNPESLFVARFIGTPSMNLIDARLTATGVELADGTPLDLPRPYPAADAGRPVLIGLRPEAVLLAGDGAGLPARVESLEPLGQEIIVEFAAECAAPLRSRVPPETELTVGEQVRLRLDTIRAHVFDPATGKVLLPPP